MSLYIRRDGDVQLVLSTGIYARVRKLIAAPERYFLVEKQLNNK